MASFQGIHKAEYSTDDNTWTEIKQLTDQSGVTFEAPDEEKTPTGEPYFGGMITGVELHFLDKASYDALIALYAADERISLRLHVGDPAANDTETISGVLPVVRKGDLRGAAGGRRTYILQPRGFTVNP